MSHTPWEAFPYKPKVEFAIAYATDSILLKYYVIENTIRAVNHAINTAVYEDSCVEFFISFDQKAYYNLEFNCIGSCLAGFGKGKEDRELIPSHVISGIKYQSVINNQKCGSVHWELTLAIPNAVFIYHQLSTLQGKKCFVNFYKCGDALPEPHFVTWSDIQFESPNFHLPQFFGALIFEPQSRKTSIF